MGETITFSGAANDLDRALAELGIHDHLCLIYDAQEDQFAAAIPFIRIGLERNERCIYIADDNTATDVLVALRDNGVDVDAAIQRGQINVATKREAYLRADTFDPDYMISFLAEETEAAKADGYTALRVTGEMTWALGNAPGADRLMEYEAKLNEFFPTHNCLALCQYNRRRFPPEIIRDVIRIHPRIVYGRTVCRNPYHVPSAELLRPDGPEREVEQLLAGLRGWQRSDTALHESEKQLRELFERNLAGVYRTKLDGTILDCNQSMAAMFGYSSREELLSCQAWDLYFERSDRTTFIDRLRASDSLTNSECRMRRKDGTALDILENVLLLPDETGKPAIIQGTMIDITEYKQAEKALRASEQKYRELVENIPDVAWTTDCWGHTSFISPNIKRIYGFTQEEIYAAGERLWWERIHPDDIDHVKQAAAALFENDEPFDVEYRIKRKDGSWIWLRDWAITTYERNGIKYADGVFSDITERKRAEEALRESNERFRLVSHATCDYIWDWDLKTNYVWRNDRFYERFGALAPEEDPYDYWLQRLHPDDRERAMARVKTAVEGGESPWTNEYRFRQSDGEYAHVIDRGYAVRDAQGVTYRVVGAIQDITERKRSEEALKESRRRLTTLMSNLPGMVYRCKNEPNWTMEFVSDGCFALTGYKPEELVSNSRIPYGDVILPKDRQMVWDVVQDALKNKRSFEVIYQITTANGERKWSWEQGQGVFGKEGEVVAIEGFIADISERIRSEEELRHSEELLNETSRIAHIGGWEHDLLTDKAVWTRGGYIRDS